MLAGILFAFPAVGGFGRGGRGCLFQPPGGDLGAMVGGFESMYRSLMPAKLVEEPGGLVAFAGQRPHQFIGGDRMGVAVIGAPGPPSLLQSGGGADRLAGGLATQDEVGGFGE
jgi:hypothetical protein